MGSVVALPRFGSHVCPFRAIASTARDHDAGRTPGVLHASDHTRGFSTRTRSLHELPADIIINDTK